MRTIDAPAAAPWAMVAAAPALRNGVPSETARVRPEAGRFASMAVQAGVARGGPGGIGAESGRGGASGSPKGLPGKTGPGSWATAVAGTAARHASRIRTRRTMDDDGVPG